MSEYIPFLYSSLALGLGGLFVVRGFRDLRRRRLIEDTPTSTTRALAVGPVEVAGVAQTLPEARPRAPFTGDACAFARWKVEEERQTGKRRTWVTVAKGDTGPFLLRDDTGAVLVDPEDADVEEDDAIAATSTLGRDPPAHVRAFLDRQDIAWEGFLGANKKMRYSQIVFPEGDPCYVIGAAHPDERAAALRAKGAVATDLALAAGGRRRAFLIARTEQRARSRHARRTGWALPLGAFGIVLGLGMLLRDLGVG